MAVDFAAKRKEAEKAGLIGGGDYLKLREGGNRVRLMSECIGHKGEFQGKPNFKWLCYVLDRTDGKIKPFFMSHTIYKQIEALQLNDDYAFNDVPMPYDIAINADGAGTKEVKYTVIPARKESALTADEIAKWAEAKPLVDVKKALDEKKAKDGGNPPQDDAPHHTDEDFG